MGKFRDFINETTRVRTENISGIKIISKTTVPVNAEPLSVIIAKDDQDLLYYTYPQIWDKGIWILVESYGKPLHLDEEPMDEVISIIQRSLEDSYNAGKDFMKWRSQMSPENWKQFLQKTTHTSPKADSGTRHAISRNLANQYMPNLPQPSEN
jgi:hypothetical protein